MVGGGRGGGEGEGECGGGDSLALPRHAARPVVAAASRLADGFSGEKKTREKKKSKCEFLLLTKLAVMLTLTKRRENAATASTEFQEYFGFLQK